MDLRESGNIHDTQLNLTNVLVAQDNKKRFNCLDLAKPRDELERMPRWR